MHDRYRVSIEVLENGFAVEVPDLEEMAKAQAAAKNKGNSMPYLGDYMKKYAAKNVKEAVRIVSTALEKIPDAEYDAAFDEAAAKK